MKTWLKPRLCLETDPKFRISDINANSQFYPKWSFCAKRCIFWKSQIGVTWSLCPSGSLSRWQFSSVCPIKAWRRFLLSFLNPCFCILGKKKPFHAWETKKKKKKNSQRPRVCEVLRSNLLWQTLWWSNTNWKEADRFLVRKENWICCRSMTSRNLLFSLHFLLWKQSSPSPPIKLSDPEQFPGKYGHPSERVLSIQADYCSKQHKLGKCCVCSVAKPEG